MVRNRVILRFIATLVALVLGAMAGACTDAAERSKTEEARDKAELDKILADMRNRKIYRTLTVEVLRSISDEDLELAIADYVDTKIGDHYETEVTIVRSLAPGIRAMYATWLVELEVNNGGYNQFFWNSSGVFAEEAVEGFKFFGLPELAGLTREAIEKYQAEAEQVERLKDRGTWDAFSGSYDHTNLEPLDDRFMELSTTLSATRIKRVREQPELFTGS